MDESKNLMSFPESEDKNIPLEECSVSQESEKIENEPRPTLIMTESKFLKSSEASTDGIPFEFSRSEVFNSPVSGQTHKANDPFSPEFGVEISESKCPTSFSEPTSEKPLVEFSPGPSSTSDDAGRVQPSELNVPLPLEIIQPVKAPSPMQESPPQVVPALESSPGEETLTEDSSNSAEPVWIQTTQVGTQKDNPIVSYVLNRPSLVASSPRVSPPGSTSTPSSESTIQESEKESDSETSPDPSNEESSDTSVKESGNERSPEERERILKEKLVLVSKAIENFHIHPLYEPCTCIRIYEDIRNAYNPKPTRATVLSENMFQVKLDVSWFEKRHIFVQVNGDRISVEAMRESEEKVYEYHRIHQIFNIPKSTDKSSITATLENGELIIEGLPK